MSESDTHRRLVRDLAARIHRMRPHYRVVADLPGSPGDPVPPLVGSFRPDVYASDRRRPGLARIIGEAKTTGLDGEHTARQVSAFLQHLAGDSSNLFVMAVPGELADRCRTVLAFLRAAHASPTVSVAVFDELDIWLLDTGAGAQWRLV